MGFVIDVELQKEVQQLFSFEIWIFTTHQNTTLRQIHPFCTKKISKCPVSPHPLPLPRCSEALASGSPLIVFVLYL